MKEIYIKSTSAQLWPETTVGHNPIKMKMARHPNIGMWGVYSEAMAWNVGAVHSDFNL